MKNLVIISISEFSFSVMYEEKVYYRGFQEDTLADEVRWAYDSENFEERLKEKFKGKEIIICEDGGIEKL